MRVLLSRSRKVTAVSKNQNSWYMDEVLINFLLRVELFLGVWMLVPSTPILEGVDCVIRVSFGPPLDCKIIKRSFNSRYAPDQN